MNKNTRIAVGIVVALAVFVLGFALGGMHPVKAPSSPGAVTSTTSTVGTPSVTATSSYVTLGWDVLRDDRNGFEFKYPNGLEAAKGPQAPDPSWRSDNTVPNISGITAANVTIPKVLEINTNFADASFHVGVSQNDRAIATCLQPLNGAAEGIATSTETVNGTTFTAYKTRDAGAGNRYDTTSYRAVRNGRCYALDLTVHYTVLENYSKEFGYTEFDRQKIENILSSILGTFKFL